MTRSSEKPAILVVDDSPDNLALMSGLLKDDYQVKIAGSGEKALRVAAAPPRPDLVLLDILMPGLDGYETLRRLKAVKETRDIPVIFLTAMTEEEDERKGFECGAVDYITKPVSPSILLARVKTHLSLKAGADFLRDKNDYLEAEVSRRTRDVEAIQDVTIFTLASLAETRDNDTGNHIRRTQHYVKTLSERLSARRTGARRLSDPDIRLLFKSAPLHDIGKVGIPDAVLMKPGKLDPEEFTVMKNHARLGFMALSKAERALGTQVEFLCVAKEMALSHHEKWDGSGYPEGLAGGDIPLSARLMSVADVYDALVSDRVYKRGMSHEQAFETVIQGRGSHFDPEIVDAFSEAQGEWREIARRFADPDPSR